MARTSTGGGFCPACVFLLKGLIATTPDTATWLLWEQYMATPDPAIMDQIFARPPDVVARARAHARRITQARAGML